MEVINIIVICAFILLLFIIYYELELNHYKKEHFTQKSNNILIQPTNLNNNRSIGDIINIPYIDLNKLLNDNLKTSALLNLALLDGRITGLEIYKNKKDEMKVNLLTGVTERKIDLSSNRYNDVKSINVMIYKDNDKMMRDPSNIYIAYPHKLPFDFIASQNMKKIPIDQLNFNINNIGELINKLGTDCTKDNNCGGFYIALNDKNELIIANIENQIDVSKLRDYPYTMNGDILTTILCVKQSPDQINLANKMVGACAKLTLKSKDVGKDCFGQLWAENKCDGPIPVYTDTFKSLSYEELSKELVDSKCYTDPAWKRENTVERKLEEKKPSLMDKLNSLLK
jgi:hypothetical protein